MADSRFVHKRTKVAVPNSIATEQPQRRVVVLETQEDAVAGKTIDFDENTEVGGFNPERRSEKKKEPVGPAPTDDPKGHAHEDLKKKIEEQTPRRSSE